MDALIWLLFESHIALGILAGLVCFVLLVWWRRGGSRTPLLIALAASAVALVVQAFVVTHREVALGAFDTLSRAVVAGRHDAIGLLLSPDFDAGQYRGARLDRQMFLEYAREALLEIDVHSASLQRLELEPADVGFDAVVSYFAEVSLSDVRYPSRSRWRARFVETAEGWRIQSFTPEEIEGMAAASWDRIRRP